MTRHAYRGAALTAAAVVAVFAILFAGQSARAQSFDRQGMVTGWLTETILPLHEAFAAEAAELEMAALAFDADPTEDTLAAFREAWVDAVVAYERIQLFSLQRVMPLLSQLDSSPTNVQSIEQAISFQAEGTIDTLFVETLGSPAKGFSALEYLIFARPLPPLAAVQNRRDYAASIAADMRRIADELVVQWTPGTDGYYGDRFIADEFELSNVRGMVSMVINEMIANVEDIGKFHVGDPAGYRSGGTPQPQLVESPYSGTSIRRLQANMETFREIVYGRGTAPSLADYMDFIGAELNGEPFSAVLAAQLDAITAALDAVEEPFAQSIVQNPDAVLTLYTEMRNLLVLTKTDMANQLGITITFGDSDGD
ncbi:MAG: imelysin family protein [Chloroflexi bacterium]|nr:imelysin family protein [Chloroflexota bacterium]